MLATDLRNQEQHASDVADVKQYAEQPLEKAATQGCILPLVYEKALRLEMPDEAAQILRAYQLNHYWGDLDSTFRTLNPGAWDIVYNRRAARTARGRFTPEKWLAGEGNAYQSFDATLVRRKDDRLQTTKGAEAPWSHAVAIFLRAQRCRNESTSWRPNGERFRAGHFELDRIDASGGINIGCHRIEFSEMLRLAVKEVPQLVTAQYPLPAVI
ncbi:hypothetical protein [Methylocystis hirsuta]|uniref:hypothetical protein n=1 Tax=Methylocystis hirsuta TaxID=369798 RepID=UPI0011CE9943|nr:hypothetical protein [Methylocystis hirsuta]